MHVIGAVAEIMIQTEREKTKAQRERQRHREKDRDTERAILGLTEVLKLPNLMPVSYFFHQVNTSLSFQSFQIAPLRIDYTEHSICEHIGPTLIQVITLT